MMSRRCALHSIYMPLRGLSLRDTLCCEPQGPSNIISSVVVQQTTVEWMLTELGEVCMPEGGIVQAMRLRVAVWSM